MIDFGTVAPGTLLYVPFQTFDSNDPSASVTLTGLATTDIEVYRDGSVTQRASDAGYALLDTDGIDFDSTTGIHGFSIDTADNTTAGFYRCGSQYWIVVASITVDAATVNFIAATFRIGLPGAAINSYMATRASQTSFTLPTTARPGANDALNGWTCVITDIDDTVDVQTAYVSDYVASTGTVTLSADPGLFTTVANDGVSFFPPVGVGAWNQVALATTNPLPNAAADAAGGLPISDAGGLDLDAMNTNVNDIETDTNELQTDWANGGRLDLIIDDILLDTAEIGAAGAGLTALATQASVNTVDSNVDAILVDTNELQTDDVPGLIAALNDPTAATIADAVWDEAQGDHVAAGSMGLIASETGDILADTNELQTDDVPGLIAALNDPTAATIADAVWDEAQGDHVTVGSFGETATEIASILADTNELQTDDVPGLIAALNDIDAAAVNAEVLDVLNTDTFAELGSVPAATTTLANKITWLFMLARNRVLQTATVATVRSNADVGDVATAAVADDGTTWDRDEWA